MKIILLAASFLLFIFDLNAKIIYVDPVPESKYVNVKNTIVIGFDDLIKSTEISSLITVTGSLSGLHNGEVILTDKGKKLIFKPYEPFAYNETVEVRLNNLRTKSKNNNSLNFTFHTQNIKPVSTTNYIENSEYDLTMSGNRFPFANENSLPVPQPVTTISNNPSPGRILMGNLRNANYNSHIMIANNDGSLYYSQDLIVAVDFRRQPNGLLTYYGYSKYYSVDASYNRIDSFYCGNGYSTDGHELKILNNEHALLMCYDSQYVDMSAVIAGGNTNAIVIGLVIQEIDKNKNVVFQWRSWDHVDILDGVNVNFLASTVDYIHGNAIELDNDGNLLISSRHLNEISKISRSTGEFIWRLGGVNNEFTFVNDTIPFHYQHDIRRLENGNITMFDNGNFRTPLVSRALEYQLDEVNKVATLVWQYKHTPVVYGAFMGSVQRLQNGNTLIGWGGTSPALTEVTPSGTIALEMTLPAGTFSYRVMRDEVQLTLNVKLAIEGLYNSVTDKLEMKDTVSIFLRNSVSPFNIVDSLKTVVDSVNMNCNYRFYNVPTGVYYFSIKHRNALETWSKAGGESYTTGGVYNYNFTSQSSNAYGSNQKLKGIKYCIYSGDTDQNGIIDAADMSQIENAAFESVTGYVPTDVNGDNFVDASDKSIVENNVALGISVITP